MSSLYFHNQLDNVLFYLMVRKKYVFYIPIIKLTMIYGKSRKRVFVRITTQSKVQQVSIATQKYIKKMYKV